MATRRNLGRDERAEIGNSALLLFIASLMVATAAIGVFMNQTTAFGSHASAVAHEQATSEAVRLSFLSVVGHRPADPGDITTIDVYGAVVSQGPTLDLTTSTLYLATPTGVLSLAYVDGAASATEYSADAIRDADGSFSPAAPILDGTDTFHLAIDLGAAGLSLATGEALFLRLEPEHAAPISLDARAPAVFGDALDVQLA